MFDNCVEYKTIAGYDGYRFGADGSVWTERITGPSGGSPRMTGSWRRLKTWIYKHRKKPTHKLKQYHRTCLMVDGKEVYRFVHTLVCEAFYGKRPTGMFATHNDGNSLNNNAVNLSWKTPAGNTRDAIRHGTLCRGESHGMHKFTHDQVREVRRRHAAGEKISSLSREFGVTNRAVDFIVKRQHYAHIT
jgi:hypothetical protein